MHHKKWVRRWMVASWGWCFRTIFSSFFAVIDSNIFPFLRIFRLEAENKENIEEKRVFKIFGGAKIFFQEFIENS
jgi:hypothetical protein